MRIYYTDHFVLPLPPGHRFPMAKYALLRQRVVAAGLVPPDDLVVPHAATDDELGRVHDAAYVWRVTNGGLTPEEIRRIGFPWSPQLVERSRRSVGATIEACRAALDDGVAANLAGGTHHAFPDRGEGFCVFNDVAVAARAMQAAGSVNRVLIVDCDVHQGNGTAAIFRDDATVRTLDLYGAGNYPFEKERSHVDVPIVDGTGDTAYLGLLHTGLHRALDGWRPDLAIYVSGADPFIGDRLGRLALSKEGLSARDRLVFGGCAAQGIPVAVTMGGGYSGDVGDTVGIHFATVRVAAEVCDALEMAG